jgi:peptide/nickel transport system ATP-binding protein
LSIEAGTTVALIGESGSGKSTLGRLLLRLIVPETGAIRFEGRDVVMAGRHELRDLRRRMQILFQHPDGAFHPRRVLLDSLIEPMRLHRLADRRAACERAVALTEELGLRAELLARYPHQVSGGQLQRMALARALTLDPRFLVLDEPTSMLDVSVQAQVVAVLRAAQRRHGLAYLFITHDLDLAAAVGDSIAVMHRGRIVERGFPQVILGRPEQDYTRKLVAAFGATVPSPG